MSTERDGSSIWGIFTIAFLVLKLGGTSLITWSWWWLLLPMIPVLVVIFQKLGLL